MLPPIDAAAIREAMDRFDRQLRGGNEDWQHDGRQKYAISEAGRLYPPKAIVRLASGQQNFGSIEARIRLKALGYTIVELAGSDDTQWKEFASWVKRIAESSDIIAEEKAYKLEIIQNVGNARESFQRRDADWLITLRKAFGPPNNLTPWIMHDNFLKWCAQEPEAAETALSLLWTTSSDLLKRLDDLADSLPSHLIGPGLRVTLASFLLMPEDADNIPIYRETPLLRAYKGTGFSRPPSGAKASEVYQNAMDFFDRVLDEVESVGVMLADRLEAQGATWAVVNYDLDGEPFTSWPPEEVAALRRFRGEQQTPTHWWVNQGATFAQESGGGYVWAPQRNSAGSQLAHHANVSRLRTGHQLVHYANGAIRAVGTVLEDAEDAPRPSELPEGPWETNGRFAKVEYRMLDRPLPLEAIPRDQRIAESNPFDSSGNVRQGYMYPLTNDFWATLMHLTGKTADDPGGSLFLVGAQGEPIGAASYFKELSDLIAEKGRAANWWSYPLNEQHRAALEAHPYLYLYISAPTSQITHRFRIVEHATQAGPLGIESPWPEYSRPEEVSLTRKGEAQNQVFKTWFLINAVEELDESIVLSDLVTTAGAPAVPSSLLGGFGLWRRANAQPARSWVFQANPELFDLRSAIRELREFTWTTRQHAKDITPGDRVYLWESGSTGGIVATATVLTNPTEMPQTQGSGRFERTPGTFSNVENRVLLRVDQVLEPQLTRAELQANPALASMMIFRIPQQTNLSVTPDEAAELERLVTSRLTANQPMTIEDLVRVTNLTEAELEEIESLLEEKRQLILEGPPGSGKTYLARWFARYFTGNRLEGEPDERVQVVQFHQSYGYEEFIQGIRPTTVDGQLHYDVQPGIFKTLCSTAKSNPTKRFVLIVDEINRGNISRIFGELLYLLEYRDESVKLGNSTTEDAPFSIPSNVFLLGTMNTTDRSLTQIDYALRRRFFFYRLLPVVHGEAPVLREWLRSQGISAADRDRLLRLFVALNQKIADELGEHFQLGHSYLMKPGIERQDVLAQVWQRAVLPLLEEYFHHRRNLTDYLAEFSIERLDAAAQP